MRSIDEVWYKRAVEQHYIEPQSFVYSVPFNEGRLSLNYLDRLILVGDELMITIIHEIVYYILFLFSIPDDTRFDAKNLRVTASHAIFHTEDKMAAPVAVVGYQFQHSALLALFQNITSNVGFS